MPTQTPPPLPEVLGSLVTAAHRLTRLAAVAAGSSESPAVWRTLSALAPAPARIGDLAERSRVAQPTMTKLVASLEARGWAERAADPDDRRATSIAVTPAGLAALDAWRSRLVDELVPLFSDASGAEVAAIATAVEVIEARLERGAERRGGDE